MLDSDLAAIYGYTTSRFNEQVSNNNERFQGEEFSFFLTKDEFTNLMSNKSISSWGGRRKMPRVFTEDRFLILDEKKLYHIGASIKDAGKKAFEISVNGDEKLLDAILNRL